MANSSLQGIAWGVNLFCLVLCASADAAASTSYQVEVAADLARLDVSVCFDGQPPTALQLSDPDARGDLLFAARHRADRLRAIKPEANSIPLQTLKRGDCLRYAVATRHVAPGRWKKSIRQHREILLDPKDWLWLPSGSMAREPIEVHFRLPKGMNVSAPWHPLRRNPSRVSYQINQRDPDWDGRVALGYFVVEEMRVAGAKLRFALLRGEPRVDRTMLDSWFERNVQALLQLYGKLPVPELQVLVIPVADGDEPVPWAQVMRGGGDALHLYIDQTRPPAEFFSDWVLIHEMSHLSHPRLQAKDAWFAEGLASYYQDILRARQGMISPQQAWAKLHAGFQRGIKGTPKGLTLAEATETMMRDHTYMRVYWSGAAIALLADVELRKRSHGMQSLGSTLKKFAACCLPARRAWEGGELMDKLDQLSNSKVFSTLYKEYANSIHFPRLDGVYRELGLVADGDTIRLSDDAPQSAVRRAITSPLTN